MSRRAPEALREVIRDFRRDQIIEVAKDLFGARGTIDIAMDEIASTAGVARSTVYVYFKNRDELLRACLGQMYQHLMDAVVDVLDHEVSLPEQLRGLVRGLLDRIDENPSFFRLAVATQSIGGPGAGEAIGAELSVISLDMARILEALVTRGIEERLFREIDPVRGAALIGQQIFGALSVRAGEPNPIPLDDAAAEICLFILHGLLDASVMATA